MPSTENQFAIQDPRTQYPQPPFPEQPQDAPGLASKMDPTPDHGEESYVGFGRLKGRKALITGADSGIGRAAAIAYAREGADLVLNYLDSEESDAQEVVALAEAAGVKVTTRPGDISDESFCNQLIADAVEDLGGLDLLVQVAGKQKAVESIADITTAQFDKTFKTNVYSLFWLSKAALPHMPPGSALINTASIQSYAPNANLLDYATTKAAIVAFTKSLAGQAIEQGIRVNCVAPGPFWTALQPSGGQPDDAIPTFGEAVPLGRPGQPAEIAPIYVLLATQESSYITGETFGVTGGDPTP
ncbi:MAG: SDR family oxidoreductase [Solirubrobacteraceae bacterium]|nr:SDR family oxidoreductase [Solirubrobacteraceae bacterium]